MMSLFFFSQLIAKKIKDSWGFLSLSLYFDRIFDRQLCFENSTDRWIVLVSLLVSESSFPLHRSASIESTQSEREFRKRHQAITHRMVHRKSSAIMYNKILERTFGTSVSVNHVFIYSFCFIWDVNFSQKYT